MSYPTDPPGRSAPVVARLLVVVALLSIPRGDGLAQPPPAQPVPHGPVFGVHDDAPTPGPASIPPPREAVRLEYAAPPGCPDEQALRNAVASRLGYDPVSPSAARLLRVAIAREAAVFTATAEIRDGSGRVAWSRPPLADADCRALVDVMGLSLKFAIDPASAAAQPPPTIVLQPPALLPPPSPGPPAADQPSRPPSSRPRVRLGARAAATIAAAPAVTGTITADAGVGWTYFSIALEGRADVPVTGAVDYGVQARTRVAAGSVVPCGHYGWFAGCGVLSVGELWAEGVSTRNPAVGTAVYAAAGPRLGLEWPVPRVPSVALRLSLDVLVTIHPITALVDAMHVWSAPPFAGMLGGGLVVKL